MRVSHLHAAGVPNHHIVLTILNRRFDSLFRRMMAHRHVIEEHARVAGMCGLLRLRASLLLLLHRCQSLLVGWLIGLWHRDMHLRLKRIGLTISYVYDSFG